MHHADVTCDLLYFALLYSQSHQSHTTPRVTLFNNLYNIYDIKEKNLPSYTTNKKKHCRMCSLYNFFFY